MTPHIQKIYLENILSFGVATELELRPLNVFIGPNSSGKSNLIDSIDLLRSSSFDSFSRRDMRTLMNRSGGSQEWFHKGSSSQSASIKVEIAGIGKSPLKHFLGFSLYSEIFHIDSESIDKGSKKLFGRRAIVSQLSGDAKLPKEITKGEASVIAYLNDLSAYPDFHALSRFYSAIRIFRDWEFGRNGKLRKLQAIDTLGDRLEEDFSNLAHFLNNLVQTPKVKRLFLEKLKDIYNGITDIQFAVIGGMLQLAIVEGDFRIPVSRLSDGTLRYLCLLALLCDPIPPPVICIEEPELGLHPDILPGLADLLIDASSRTQLIITTHSDMLVSALSEVPESVVVCEKHNGQTEMRRLRKEEVDPWLNEYRLGELWIDGQIGGKRW